MKKFYKGIAAFTAAAALTITAGASVMPNLNNQSAAAVDTNNDDWLHAVGSRLYDKDGNEVWLTGANWFGLNCSENIPHYLWTADVDDLLREISDRGINVIRFPISSELLISWMNGTPNPVSSVHAGNDQYDYINADFCNADGSVKNSMEIFDVIVKKLKKYGLKCFVDIHSAKADNSGHVYPLWYDGDITTELWIDSLTWLAEKYNNDDTILGYDLQNEPHGKGQEGSDAAKWDGSTDINNWAYAATQCANSILEVNPNALIFIEGVEQQCREGISPEKGVEYYWGMGDSQTDPPYYPGWWGGQLRGVRKWPVKPDSGTSQIVYSPHDYGPHTYYQDWFKKDFTTQTLLDDYWYDTWAFINAENIAPLLIGEWGGHLDEGDEITAKEQKWMELLRDYMVSNHISHTFWCLNTNSGDTGGLWKNLAFSNKGGADPNDNGTTVEWDEDKYALFEVSLWQTQETGKYIGLDHEKSLGQNGISLNEFYDSYAYTEGSNLDGGTILTGGETKPSTETPPQTTTTTDIVDDILYGDANDNGDIEVADAVFILQGLADPSNDEFEFSKEGAKKADCHNNGNGVDAEDALAVLQFKAQIITKLPCTK